MRYDKEIAKNNNKQTNIDPSICWHFQSESRSPTGFLTWWNSRRISQISETRRKQDIQVPIQPWWLTFLLNQRLVIAPHQRLVLHQVRDNSVISHGFQSHLTVWSQFCAFNTFFKWEKDHPGQSHKFITKKTSVIFSSSAIKSRCQWHRKQTEYQNISQNVRSLYDLGNWHTIEITTILIVKYGIFQTTS